jgi:hypothetical protein
MNRAKVALSSGVPGRVFAKHDSSTNRPISHRAYPQRLVRGAVRDAGRPGRRSSPRSSHLAPDGYLDRLDVAGPIQDGVGGGLAGGQDQVVDHIAPGRPAAAACWFGRHADAPARPSARRQPRRPATAPAGVAVVMPCLEGPVGPGSTDPSPQGSGGGGASAQLPPRQRPPAISIARSFSDGAALAHPPDPPQPVQLRRQRPGAVLQVLQVATAVERPPVDAARPAAPIAGLRGARTGVVGLGPAAATAALAESRAGRDGDLPGPAGLPAAHQVSPPLAWSPGSDQPT